MGKVKVSIVIPVHNLQSCLRECLDSVTGQSLQDIEIICIDDASTDGSLQILQDYCKKDDRVIVYRISKSGPGAARNKGMEIAAGEFIGFVDGDDMVKEGMFERLYESATRNDADISLCFPECFDHCTQETVDVDYFRIARKKLGSKEGESVYNGEESMARLSYIPVVPWNKIYRRTMLRQCAAAFAEGLKHEDFPFYFQTMLHAGKITLVRESLYRYRVNRTGSLTYNSGPEVFTDASRIFNVIEQSLSDKLKRPSAAKNYAMFKVKHMIAWLNGILLNANMDKEEKRQFFNTVRTEIGKIPLFPALDPVDKIQHFLVKRNQFSLFRLKVFLDEIKPGNKNKSQSGHEIY